MENIIEILNTRIQELRNADSAFCEKRWDMSLSHMERSIYREQSNSVTFARQELESIRDFIINNLKSNTNESNNKI